jgi:hypothetical protein
MYTHKDLSKSNDILHLHTSLNFEERQAFSSPVRFGSRRRCCHLGPHLHTCLHVICTESVYTRARVRACVTFVSLYSGLLRSSCSASLAPSNNLTRSLPHTTELLLASHVDGMVRSSNISGCLYMMHECGQYAHLYQLSPACERSNTPHTHRDGK